MGLYGNDFFRAEKVAKLLNCVMDVNLINYLLSLLNLSGKLSLIKTRILCTRAVPTN